MLIALPDERVADRSRMHGHRQVTDVYLLALAVQHEGCLATFDTGIPLAAVARARRQHLVVI